MNKKIILILTILTTLIFCSKRTALDNYPNIKYIATDKNILAFYCEPIMASKMMLINNNEIKKISFSDSFHEVGHINTNNITISKEDSKDSMKFNFNKVTYYRTKIAGDSFSIMYIKAKCNKEKYEIILELRDPSKENRMLFIYKKGIPLLIISFPDYILGYSIKFFNAI